VGLQFDNTPDSVPDGPKLASVKKNQFCRRGREKPCSNRCPKIAGAEKI
jgi:hypothetical protein